MRLQSPDKEHTSENRFFQNRFNDQRTYTTDDKPHKIIDYHIFTDVIGREFQIKKESGSQNEKSTWQQICKYLIGV